MTDPFAFFSIPSPTVSQPSARRAKKEDAVDCSSCPHTLMNLPEIVWKGRYKVLIIGESPNAITAHNGPFSDAPGSIFWEACDAVDFTAQKEAWHTYAVQCPGTNCETALKACRSKLLKTIEHLKPHVIIPVGIEATQALLSHRLEGRIKGTKPTAFFGETIPDQEMQAWICPISSPNYIYRIEQLKQKTKANWQALDARVMLQNELAGAIAKIDEPLPVWNERIFTHTTPQDATRALESLLNYEGDLAFDFETSGLKPHRERHHIPTVAVAWTDSEGDRADTMPFYIGWAPFKLAWQKLMKHPRLKKIAHNAGFEMTWDKVRGSGDWQHGKYWDTCIGAHVIKNTAPTGLKFQVFVKLGILAWDSEADPYLKSDPVEAAEYGANAFNNIDSAPMGPLLKYNAKDALYTLWLKRWQEPRLQAFGMKGFKLFTDGIDTFAKTSDHGMPFDEAHAKDQIAKISVQIQEQMAIIANIPELRAKGIWINVDSEKDLKHLLYVTLKTPIPRVGKSVDVDALSEIDTPLTRAILARRKLKKMQDYLKNYLRESVDGKVHPFFNLHKVVTFRSSSDSPNAQNIPKRDKVAKKAIRSCYKPDPGHMLVEWDLKGAEVGAAASITKDPALIKYQTDFENTDMHRDCAMQIFMWDKENYWGGVRGSIKNGWTFPEFYGSTVNSGVAENLWYDIPQSLRDEMSVKLAPRLRILESIWDNSGRHGEQPTTYTAWCQHLNEIEKDFWGNRFPDYQEWKWDIWKFYRSHGYVELVTGFRCYGPLAYNEATNSPIQGPAFHINLAAMNMNAPTILKATKGRSKLMGQIHDSQIGNIHPDDLELCNGIMRQSMERIRETWNWIRVPIIVEWEAGGVDESMDMIGSHKELTGEIAIA